MRSNKIYMYGLTIAGLACLLWAYQREVDTKQRRAQLAVVEQIRTAEKLIPAQDPRTEANQIDDRYLQIKMRKRGEKIDSAALIEIARCLRSDDVTLRTHCQELSLNMLSDWTFNRPEPEWHSSPEVDEFFRIFKSTEYAELKRFFYGRALDFEQKYLSQI